jgi:hypothetical protein
MSLSSLTEIVKNATASIKCPKCTKGFADNSVEVVDITGDRGLFSGHCRYCNSATLVSMNIKEFRQKIAKRNKQISKIVVNKISPTDVVELKNFLADFDGDFKKILGQKKDVLREAKR